MGIPINQLIGSASFKFDNLGDTVKGTIVSVEQTQQMDMDTNAPQWWDDNRTRPKLQLKIVLQTALRDNDADDGLRTIYAKGGNAAPASGSGQAMEQAIVSAVQKAGAASIDEGAELIVRWTGEGEQKKRGYNAPKLYTVRYTPPVRGVQINGDPFADMAPQQQQPQYGMAQPQPQYVNVNPAQPQQGSPFPPNPQYAQQAPVQQQAPQRDLSNLDDF